MRPKAAEQVRARHEYATASLDPRYKIWEKVGNAL